MSLSATHERFGDQGIMGAGDPGRVLCHERDRPFASLAGHSLVAKGVVQQTGDLTIVFVGGRAKV